MQLQVATPIETKFSRANIRRMNDLPGFTTVAVCCRKPTTDSNSGTMTQQAPHQLLQPGQLFGRQPQFASYCVYLDAEQREASCWALGLITRQGNAQARTFLLEDVQVVGTSGRFQRANYGEVVRLDISLGQERARAHLPCPPCHSVHCDILQRA